MRGKMSGMTIGKGGQKSSSKEEKFRRTMPQYTHVELPLLFSLMQGYDKLEWRVRQKSRE